MVSVYSLQMCFMHFKCFPTFKCLIFPGKQQEHNLEKMEFVWPKKSNCGPFIACVTSGITSGRLSETCLAESFQLENPTFPAVSGLILPTMAGVCTKPFCITRMQNEMLKNHVSD